MFMSCYGKKWPALGIGGYGAFTNSASQYIVLWVHNFFLISVTKS